MAWWQIKGGERKNSPKVMVMINNGMVNTYKHLNFNFKNLKLFVFCFACLRKALMFASDCTIFIQRTDQDQKF